MSRDPWTSELSGGASCPPKSQGHSLCLQLRIQELASLRPKLSEASSPWLKQGTSRLCLPPVRLENTAVLNNPCPKSNAFKSGPWQDKGTPRFITGESGVRLMHEAEVLPQCSKPCRCGGVSHSTFLPTLLIVGMIGAILPSSPRGIGIEVYIPEASTKS